MIDLRPLANLISDRLRALPLLVLYITDGCNSRCITCDIWKLPRRNMDLALVEYLAGQARSLGLRQVVLSGGEAMQHPRWPDIAARFRAAGVRVMLLTNGLLLKKQAQQVIESVDALTVSLDGGTPQTYHHIRGVDALPVILDGMAAISAAGIPVTTRTTVQRANFRELPRIVDVAKAAGARQVSFLAVDVSSHEAFGPRFQADPELQIHASPGPALTAADLPDFYAVLDTLERDYRDDFDTRRIAESPAKLRLLGRYFEAVNGRLPFAPPPCNAPHISAVVEVDGSLRPCFFLPTAGKLDGSDALTALNGEALVALRRAYRQGERPECQRCVCPLYRNARALIGGI